MTCLCFCLWILLATRPVCFHLYSKADLAPFSLMNHNVLLRIFAIGVPLNAVAPHVSTMDMTYFMIYHPLEATRKVVAELLQNPF